MIAGILLAAGKGRRFGRPKALVALDGRLLVERGVELLDAAGCTPVLVVLGAGAPQVLAEAHLGDAATVYNEDWPSGIGSSLRAGLAALPAEAEAAVVALVDQPGVRPEAVRRLVDVYRAGAAGGVQAAVASYGGAWRNPVLLARSCWAVVADSAEGEVGARAFLRAYPDRVAAVPCDDVGSPHDIDTQEDLLRMSCQVPDPPRSGGAR